MLFYTQNKNEQDRVSSPKEPEAEHQVSFQGCI